jgi:hypothetical protein
VSFKNDHGEHECLDTKSSYHSEATSLVRGNCSEATSPVEQALCTPSTCTALLSRAHQHCGQRRQATSSSASSRHHWNTKLLELGNGYGALFSSHHSEATRSVRGKTHTCTSPLSRTSSTVDKQRVVCMPACQQHASSMQAGSAPSMRTRTEVFNSSLSNRSTTFGNRHAALQATKANTHSSQGEVRSFCCTQCYSPAPRYGPAPCHGPAPYIYMSSQGESQVYWYRSCW